MHSNPAGPFEGTTLTQVDDVITGVVRGKLRVSLRPEDGRQENQDALEIVSKARLDVLSKLRSGGSIENLSDYASTVAYHACAEHLRVKHAGRFRLQYKLRYFLTHHAAFALWQEDRISMCGFARWQNEKREADSARVASAREGGAIAAPRVAADEMKAADFERLCGAVFEYVGGALPFAVFVAIAAAALGVKTYAEEAPPEQASTAPSPESATAVLEILRALWAEILLLELRWRRAFLLNPPRDFELEMLAEHGIAGIGEIGAAVALNAAEFAAVWSELGASAGGGTTPEAEFRRLWERLPLRDALIARLLGGEVQQVINLRRLARDRLADRLAPRMARRKKE